MDKKIIGLVGLIASGKGEAKKYLMKNYGAVEFRFSSILRKALDVLGIEQSRDNIISLSTWSRKNSGNDLLAKTMAKNIKENSNDLIIIDGIRRMDDIIYLKDLPSFKMLAIEADPELRYERSVKRNENPGDSEKSYKQFLEDHKKETEITIPETMNKADFKIVNENSLEDFYKELDKIIENYDN
ncbi:MAG: AAA family ATPase [Patescibacteria group bacterium]|jgi:dephospho-CoA kinase|nr:AAA family ATPase [Patescibacteria group bacterium]